MPEKKKADWVEPRQYLTAPQVKAIKQEVEELERMMEGAEDGNIHAERAGVGYFAHASKHIEDPSDLIAEISKKKKVLRDFSPTQLKGIAKDKAWGKYKQVAKWIHNNMPTAREFNTWYPKGVGTAKEDVNFNQAVERQMQWQQNGEKAVLILRNLGARIEPGNSKLLDADRLRRRG